MAQPTAQSIAQRIRASLKALEPVGATSGDDFVFGDPAAAIDRIVVCRAPTVAVLKQLPSAGRTLLVTREDPFYWTSDRYGGGSSAFTWSAGLADALKDNPITSIKHTLMSERGVIVYRLSTAWDSAQPSSRSDSLARALGLKPVRGPDVSTAYAAAPVPTLEALARFSRERLKVRTIRICGERTLPVTQLAIMSGLVTLPRLASALKDPRVDAVIVGETCEWEATPYFQDLNSSGRKLGMVLVGYASSDNWGLPAVRDFVKAAVPGVTVSAAEDTAEPSWMDQRGA